jgi:4-amino-4-deoxy-L-arabinose transferase-like glycosyltransferase
MITFWQNLWYWIDLYRGPLWLALAFILCVATAWLIWQQRQLASLRRHYRSLLDGTEGGNLETVLDQHLAQVRQAVEKVHEVDLLARDLQRAGQHHVQHSGMVRFSPFNHTGGDHSFALALADAQGYGVVLSSLHSRDSTRVYAKPLAEWESSYPLTEEEQQAIGLARGEA